MSTINDDLITICEAKTWTEKWQTENPNHCKAFLVPIQDLLGTLSEMGIIKIDDGEISGKFDETKDEMIRSYLSINPDEVKNPGKGEKLLLVGTVNTGKEDGNGNIVYQDIVAEEKSGEEAQVTYPSGVTLDGSGVFDVTRPCPNQCDPNSPLDHSK
ncbi:MAG: hypothetical protein ACI9Y7_001438 [Dokdonia sp.]|jgi:hypothetical protein